MRAMLWQLIVGLAVVAIIAWAIPWLMLVAGAGAAAWVAWRLVLVGVDRHKLGRAQRDGLLARCEQQHRWVMRGDPQGIYGPNYRDQTHGASYPAEGMYWTDTGATPTIAWMQAAPIDDDTECVAPCEHSRSYVERSR